MQAQRALVTYILNPNAVFRYTERIALNSTFYSKKICFTTGVSYFHYIIRVVLEVSDILGTFHTFLCDLHAYLALFYTLTRIIHTPLCTQMCKYIYVSIYTYKHHIRISYPHISKYIYASL
jgi:hypothetical protein